MDSGATYPFAPMLSSEHARYTSHQRPRKATMLLMPPTRLATMVVLWLFRLG